MILHEYVLSMLSMLGMGQREKTNSIPSDIILTNNILRYEFVRLSLNFKNGK